VPVVTGLSAPPRGENVQQQPQAPQRRRRDCRPHHWNGEGDGDRNLQVHSIFPRRADQVADERGTQPDAGCGPAAARQDGGDAVAQVQAERGAEQGGQHAEGAAEALPAGPEPGDALLGQVMQDHQRPAQTRDTVG
jgi:hypothetical protein